MSDSKDDYSQIWHSANSRTTSTLGWRWLMRPTGRLLLPFFGYGSATGAGRKADWLRQGDTRLLLLSQNLCLILNWLPSGLVCIVVTMTVHSSPPWVWTQRHLIRSFTIGSVCFRIQCPSLGMTHLSMDNPILEHVLWMQLELLDWHWSSLINHAGHLSAADICTCSHNCQPLYWFLPGYFMWNVASYSWI